MSKALYCADCDRIITQFVRGQKGILIAYCDNFCNGAVDAYTEGNDLLNEDSTPSTGTANAPTAPGVREEQE